MVAEFIGLVQVLHGRVVGAQAAFGQRKHADNAVHRGADLVAHAGQEGGLGLAGILGILQAVLVLFQTAVQVGGAVDGDEVHILIPQQKICIFSLFCLIFRQLCKCVGF